MPPKATTSAVARKQAPKQAKLSERAIQLYELASKNENRSLPANDVHTSFENVSSQEIMQDINALLSKGLFNVLKDSKGNLIYQAVSKEDAKETANLDTETRVCYDIIKAAGNQGIWTRSIKNKSNLHVTVVNRCIKTLEGQRKIKHIQSVKHPTRKIYMLASLTPSADLTGGPWYSDKDFDTPFIEALLKITRHFLANESIPKHPNQTKPSPTLLYPTTYTPFLPTAQDVLDFIKDTKAFPTVELTVEHMESLLHILIYDGFCERIQVRRPGVDPLDFDDENEQQQQEQDDEYEGIPSLEQNPNPAKKPKLFNDDDNEDNNQMDDIQDLPPPNDFSMTNNEEESEAMKKVRSRPKRYHVYRCIPNPASSLGVQIGLTDAPCGVCPVSHLCENRGNPFILDSPAPAVSITSKTTSRPALDDWLKMKVPGGSDLSHAGDRVWKGGAKKTEDADVPAPINPWNCLYYNQWLTW